MRGFGHRRESSAIGERERSRRDIQNKLKCGLYLEILNIKTRNSSLLVIRNSQVGRPSLVVNQRKTFIFDNKFNFQIQFRILSWMN